MFDDDKDVVKEQPLSERFPRLFKIAKIFGFFLLVWWIFNYFIDGFEQVSEENDKEISKARAKKEF
jgi:hypothetical protein